MLQQFDKRNRNIQIWVGHGLVPREEAKSAFLTVRCREEMPYGKECACIKKACTVWIGIDRLEDSALAMAFEKILKRFYSEGHQSHLGKKWDDNGYTYPVDINERKNYIRNGCG